MVSRKSNPGHPARSGLLTGVPRIAIGLRECHIVLVCRQTAVEKPVVHRSEAVNCAGIISNHIEASEVKWGSYVLPEESHPLRAKGFAPFFPRLMGVQQLIINQF